MEVDGQPDFEEWMDYGQSWKVLDGTARQFAIGDWIVHGFGTYEHGQWETIQQVWGSEVDTLRKYEYVARSIKSVRRRTDLSFGHHDAIVSVREDKQSFWLEQAAANKWSVATLRQKLSEKAYLKLYKGYMRDVLPNLGKFDLVVADPPYGVTDWEWDELETSDWLDAIIPHLSEEYNLFWFCSPKFAADIELIFREKGLRVQSRIVWHLRNMAMGS